VGAGGAQKPSAAATALQSTVSVRAPCRAREALERPLVRFIATRLVVFPVSGFLRPRRSSSSIARSPASRLRDFDLETVPRLAAAGVDYLRESLAVVAGIAEIKERPGIDTFDAVLIDGSEFTRQRGAR